MDASDVCPTEDAIRAFFEYLVDPILPAKSSLRDIPSLSQQESVAKQVHAVVLLYNYYHRKQCPKLEVLDFECFCKLVVDLKPALLAHMKTMQKSSSGTESDDHENQLSVTEKIIMDACKISLSLDVSKDVPNTEGWPISKVSVFLIDSKKENCFLLFSSITQGVWSVFEKDLGVTDHSSEDTTEAKLVNKKKRVTREPSRGESNIDEASFQKIAYSAVSEATGINPTDLLVLESHVGFSVSKEKVAAWVFIIRCTQSVNGNITQVPIKDVIDSLQGPLVQKSSSSWTVTPVVEYFHVLPYAGILLDWFYRREFSNGLQDLRLGEGNVNVCSPKRIERPCEPEIHKNQEKSPGNGVTIEDLKNNTTNSKPQSWKQKDTTGYCKTGLVDAFNGPQKIEVNKPKIQKSQNNSHVNGVMIEDLRNNTSSSKPQSLKQKDASGCCKTGLADAFNGPQKSQNKSHVNGVMIEDLRNNTSSSKPQSSKQKDASGCCKTGLANALNEPQKIVVDDSSMVSSEKPEIHKSQDKANFGMVNLTTKTFITECRPENVIAGNKNCYINSSDQDSVGGRALVTFQSSCKDLHRLQISIASKENMLSKTALKVLMKRRDELSLQQRNMEDEIARCDKKIQTILNGGEDDLALKLESIIEGCSDALLRSERTQRLHEDQCSPQNIKRKRLSEAVLNIQNPCQELDGVCYKNNWILPTYHVSSSDGGFQANVTVKGMDFERSSGSDLFSSPRQARESAAAQILVKLRSIAGQAQK